jgi:SAM-dependent methyltransferase
VQTDYATRYRTLWERHWWWRSREAFLLTWIERLNRRSPRRYILDVGCGDGLFFPRLQKFGRVEGIEASAGLVQDPRWRSRIRIGSLGSEVSPSEEYDLVLMLDVLEHIEDDLGALRSARSALRPGGHLLLTVPALPWLWSRHDEANEHYRRYTRRSLRRVLVEAGFAVETTRYFFIWTVPPLLFRRWRTPAGGGVGDYEVAIPPRMINRVLDLWSRGEHALGRLVSWPLGSSLLAIASQRRSGKVSSAPGGGVRS